MPKKFLLSIDEKLHSELKTLSSKQKLTMNTLINKFVKEGMTTMSQAH
jgi:predicted HicB family RNase H-like nuclease